VDVAVSLPEEPKAAAPATGSNPATESAAIGAPAEAGLVCTQCGFEAFPGELFCENCSAPLPGTEQTGVAVEAAAAAAPANPDAPSAASTQPIEETPIAKACAVCGGTAFQDGYCSNCGAPAVKERDHWREQPAPWVGAVTDRGIRHHRNEDAMALSAEAEPGSRAILVVCDGVSSSMDPDLASLAAAKAARDVLTSTDVISPSIAGRIKTWTDRLAEATVAANEQAVQVSRNPSNRPGERENNPPSCTFVAAVVDGPVVVIGWVGDSRAYWLPDGGTAERLSTDDSWASEAIEHGMPQAQAESAPQAHAITRWLGVDSPDIAPRCAATTPTVPGWLLVCSDGLWNYCSPAAELGELVARTAETAGWEPVALAAALVDWANAQGGMDNITVALARLTPHGST
jgi:serine/threonine protein phosphatase PrpC